MHTEHLIFRRWRESDAEALYKYASDPEVGPRAGWAPHKSVEESLMTIRTLFSDEGMWALTLKDSDEPIGCIGYLLPGTCNIAEGENEAEIGYWIARPFWNQGLCTEALRRLVEYCLHEKKMTALWGDFFVDNPASGRVMEKCGFLPTGRETLCPNLYGGAERKVRVMKLEGEERRPYFSSDTIGLFTTDNARMVAFYHEVFGFSTDWNGQEPNVEMRLGTMRLIMFPRTAFEEMTGQHYAYPAGLNGTMELSFNVPTFPDVDKAYAYALKRGATPVFPPITEPWGQRTCYVADPEGNLIEISSFCHAGEELTVDN